MNALKALFVSKVRTKLFQIFLDRPGEIYHVRQLVRLTDEEINAVRRELKRMEENGIVKKEPRGNRLCYWINPQYVFYADLISLIAKTQGLGAALLKNKNRLGKIKFAMISGKFLRGLERKEGDVDLLVVGEVVLSELARIVKNEENHRETEINYTVLTGEEFHFRKTRRDPFILQILSGSRIMIIGDEQNLVS